MTVVPELQAGLTREALQLRLPAGAARNAIDCALWSLEAAKQQKPLPALLDVTLPQSIVTAQTVVIGEPEQMAASAQALYATPHYGCRARSQTGCAMARLLHRP